MLEQSVRWRSNTLLVKEGDYLIPRIYITGDYTFSGGKIKKRKKQGGSNVFRNNGSHGTNNNGDFAK